MTRLLSALFAFGLIFGSGAQAQEYAKPAPMLPGLPALFVNCYSLDARTGWQRVPVPGQPAPRFIVLTKLNVPGERLDNTGLPYRWSVDDARYARVGPNGHQGADAESLRPYNGYKFDDRFPFAALLVRGQDVPVQHVQDVAGSYAVLEETRWLEYRINDTGLGDNGGSLYLCMGHGG